MMPMKDSAGRVIRWFGTNTDISEIKQKEERLAAQAEEFAHSRRAVETQCFMLQSVLDSMVEGLVAAEQQGNFLLWNPAAEKIVGCDYRPPLTGAATTESSFPTWLHQFHLGKPRFERTTRDTVKQVFLGTQCAGK